MWLWRRSTPAVRGLLAGLLTCELCTFASVTRCLIPDLHAAETMRRATLVEVPDSEEANQALAAELLNQGNALAHVGRLWETIAQYERGLPPQPSSSSK